MQTGGYIRVIMGAFALWGLGNAAQADIFVYQLPAGRAL